MTKASSSKSGAAPQSMMRPTLSPFMLNLLVALFIMAVDNATFWSKGHSIFEGKLFTLMLFGASVWALTLFLITFFGFRWLQKPVLIFALILSAVTSYYMDSLGVMIDREMIQNAMTTTFTESKHLITLRFAGHIVLYGLLPSALVLWVRLRPQRFWPYVATWAVASVLSFALFAGLLFSDFRTFSAVLREHKELIGSYQPGAPLGGAFRYAKMMMRTTKIVVEPLGRDATKGARLTAADKPALTVIVAGETARAQNFALDGYDRDTTPELAKRNVINFRDVSSCGTATATSLPCMFSQFGRTDYSFEKGLSNENLLDVLSHAGVNVEWWDNNTGDKHTADRVQFKDVTKTASAEFCGKGECTDGIFPPMLQQVVDTMTEDTVIVIHQIGSHGPAYHLRYTDDFERFTPACPTVEFTQCSTEQIVNAYDNTILYTDHILSQIIDLLAAQDRVISSLVYASDHGESLGEDGLYLHGAPYFMAPATQTTVPMVVWLSDAWKTAFGIDQDCVAAKAAPISHDNLFHSILGLMDIQTESRQEALDLFAGCHTPNPEAP